MPDVSNRKPINSQLISLRSINKIYGDSLVVNNVDLDISAGECIVLIGHNGAGKTTLMKMILGLTRPSSGSIEVLGGNPALGSAVAGHRILGYLPESVAFYDAMTGLEVLKFYARLKSVDVKECDELLDKVGLTEAAQRRINTYSKGMRQRLGLAQAMLGNPQLLLLDEPTTGLDPSLRHDFYDLIEGMHAQGVTSLISSHALNEVEARADRFIIMKKGLIVATGTLDQLYQQANLPVNIQLRVIPGQAGQIADRLGSNANIASVNNQSLSIFCFNGDKMPLIHRISALGDEVLDLHIMPPRLEEVYKHFMDGDTQ